MGRDKSQALNGVAALYRARQLAEQGQAPDDPDFAKRYPNVFSLLTTNKVAADQVVDGANLRISNCSGDWLVSLGVPALGAYMEIMASTVEKGLERLEATLASGASEWRFSLKRSPRIRKLKTPEK